MEVSGTLMLIVKSKLLELKKNLDEQIYALRNEMYFIKDQLSQLVIIKDNI